MTPTDPVKELIEAGEMLGLELGTLVIREMSPEQYSLYRRAYYAIPSLSAMVAREEAVKALIPKLRMQGYNPAADLLEQIFPKEGA